MKKLAPCLVLLFAINAFAAPPQQKKPAITGSATITVTGAGEQSGTYNPKYLAGDWFTTSSDGHATVTFDTGMGARRAKLDLEWDGASTTQTFNKEREALGNHKGASFYLSLMGSGAEDQMGEPSGSNTVTLTITKMDATTLEARFDGTVTKYTNMTRGNPEWHVSGTLNLHRFMTPNGTTTYLSANGATTGSLGNCDATIHDKLVGAEWRSPSECEVKFDQHVREAIDRSLAPALHSLTGAGWSANKQPKLGPIDSIARHTETKPYQLDFTSAGAYVFSLRNANAGKNSAAQQEAMQQQMAVLMKDIAKNQKQIEALSHQSATLGQGDNLSVRVTVNDTSVEVVSFRPPFTTSPLPGGGVVLHIPAAQARTGGGEDAAMPETLILLGPWGAASGKKLDAESEVVHATAALNKTKPLLSVQTITVRVEGTDANAKQFIQSIDWSALRSLLQ